MGATIRVNNVAGICHHCGKNVPEGAGRMVRGSWAQWHVSHNPAKWPRWKGERLTRACVAHPTQEADK